MELRGCVHGPARPWTGGSSGLRRLSKKKKPKTTREIQEEAATTTEEKNINAHWMSSMNEGIFIHGFLATARVMANLIVIDRPRPPPTLLLLLRYWWCSCSRRRRRRALASRRVHYSHIHTSAFLVWHCNLLLDASTILLRVDGV